MTDEEILKIQRRINDGSEPEYVRVAAGDYTYTGWLVSSFTKRSGKVRVVVEDVNGRLFIHNPAQLSREPIPITEKGRIVARLRDVASLPCGAVDFPDWMNKTNNWGDAVSALCRDAADLIGDE